MSEDARFEDGADRPLRLRALDADDLQVISALAQDAVFPVTEMRWNKPRRQFALLFNRFRWEDRARARHGAERVQCILAIEDVQGVATQGIDRTDDDIILSLLSVSFEPAKDGAGHVLLTLAGDGAIRVAVEALEVTLRDVTRPYAAPSGKTPLHPE